MPVARPIIPAAEAPPPMTLARFHEWVATAQPGSVIEYARGQSLPRREEAPRGIPPRFGAHLAAVPREALEMSERGRIDLVAKRLTPLEETGEFAWFAIKRRAAK